MTETWAYASSTSINITASPAEDLRTKYWPGQWIKITQTTDKFFIITNTSYASPVTTLTLDGGGLYTVANATITAHSYSIDQAPKDVPITFRRFPYKLDDLDAPDDNTDLDASTSKHGLMAKYPNTSAARVLKEDGTWLQRVFAVSYVFGDAAAVIASQSLGYEFPLACKITRARIRSQDANGDLLSGSVTATFYVHDYNVDADSVASSGSIALSSQTVNSETENITVAADKMVTVVLSGISTCKQVIVNFKIEAT